MVPDRMNSGAVISRGDCNVSQFKGGQNSPFVEGSIISDSSNNGSIGENNNNHNSAGGKKNTKENGFGSNSHGHIMESSGHVCGIYCSECEIAAKKSRTLLLSTGGDVIFNSSIPDISSSWMEEPGSGLRTGGSESNCSSGGNNNNNSGSSNNNNSISRSNSGRSNLTVHIRVPSYDSRTHRVVISVSLEKKSPKDDLTIISKNMSQLKESGWFYDALTYQEAQSLLGRAEPGTFLLRNSSDPRYLYSLSVQTARGPTSIRIKYANGKFQLDTDEKFNGVLPREESVIALIEHHVKSAQRTGQVWVEPNGKFYSPVVLSKPLKKMVPTLQHLCRVAFNKCPEAHERRAVAPGIKLYLADYTYRL